MSDTRSSAIVKVLFSVAFVAALASISLLYTYLSTAEDRVLKSLDSAKVLVATQALPKGTSLAEATNRKLIELRSYPVKSVPKNSLQAIDSSNQDLVALGEIPPGQILLSESFGSKVLPQVALNPGPGKVAVTVELDYGARLGSFLKPGVEVSIFATYTDAKSGAKSTKLLFDSLQILAIGDKVSQEPVVAEDASSNFVTFAVAIEKANSLIEATQSASLYLALPNSTTASAVNNL